MTKATTSITTAATSYAQTDRRTMLLESFYKWRNILQALFVRFVLCCHSWMGVCLATYVNKSFWNLIGVSFLFFVVETGIILHCRCGIEWNRFCTSFLVYLLTIIPTLWALRLNPGFLESHGNSTNTAHGINATTNYDGFLSYIAAMVPLTERVLTDLLQQSMMFVLILCRWLLPRGHIDRNSLSQLLIMYSAIGADILDFSEILTEDLVQGNAEFLYIVLAIWSWSLLQFTIVTLSSTPRRHQNNTAINHESAMSTTESTTRSEVYSILMVVFMQDGPFLFARCYAILHLKMYQYLTIFFSIKNFLTLILGVYRLVIVCGREDRGEKRVTTIEESANAVASLDE